MIAHMLINQIYVLGVQETNKCGNIERENQKNKMKNYKTLKKEETDKTIFEQNEIIVELSQKKSLLCRANK